MVIHLHPTKIQTLKDLIKPDMMDVGNDRIYITERTSVNIYSLKDYHLIKKFGREGEGPREFKISPFGTPMVAFPYGNKLYVSSMAKLSVFTPDGTFISESKLIKPFAVVLPFQDVYLMTGNTSDDKKQMVLSVNLCNEKFEKTKELYVSDIRIGPSFALDFPVNSFNFRPYKNNVYLVAGKEVFVIDVFDKKGTKLYRIKKNYKPLKVPEEYRKKTLDWFKRDPVYRLTLAFIKNRLSFKKEYPAIRDMMIADDLIYVLTYKQIKSQSECIILDLHGNERKRVFLPCPENIGMDYYPKYDIYNRTFYALLENETKDIWELHITRIQ
jgi:hypothetical protein